MKYFFPFVLSLVIILSGCAPEEQNNDDEVSENKLLSPHAEVLSYEKLPNFASGSGMGYYNGAFYAVGDDDPYLVQISSTGEILNKWQAWDTLHVKNGRINKSVKPDFEAIASFPYQADTLLIIFGSGSRSPERDIVVAFNPAIETFTHLKGATFFRWFKNHAGLTDDEINLEGAAYHKQTLYLLNRHNNEMYLLPAKGFNAFIATGDTSQLSLTTQYFELPVYQGDTARFSGASILSNTNEILFSATIEATGNWQEDGKILGSYIGIIELDHQNKKTPLCLPVMNKDTTRFGGKIEAPQGFRINESEIKVLFITDDDDGTTGWGELKVER